MILQPPRCALFPYTTLFRSIGVEAPLETEEDVEDAERQKEAAKRTYARSVAVTKEVINSIPMGRTANVKKVKRAVQAIVDRSEEHTSELQSHSDLVCRLLLE